MNTQTISSEKTNNLPADELSVRLNGTTTAQIEINPGDGNLSIDGLISDNELLADGRLEYFEKKGVPSRSIHTHGNQTSFTLKGGGMAKPWFRVPWASCNGGLDWQIHLNPVTSIDLQVHTGGGNVLLDLTGMVVTRVLADTGGGNVRIVLPDIADNLSLTAKTGAGVVEVSIPMGVAARIHATTGLGQVTVDPRFTQIEKYTYQSPDFDLATHKAEITVSSGAGVVNISSR
ncbi:hypothetical protein EG834_08350 [bacterium]|nr:hypothetical protein [bacterium]